MLKTNPTLTLVYNDYYIYRHLEYIDRIRGEILSSYILERYCKGNYGSMQYFELERKNGIYISIQEDGRKVKININLEL